MASVLRIYLLLNAKPGMSKTNYFSAFGHDKFHYHLVFIKGILVGKLIFNIIGS